MIQVYDDPASLSVAAARLFVRQSRQAVQARGRSSVALSGGYTPERTYRLLAQRPARDEIPWAQVHVFWGDERCVPSNDVRSNARMAHRALLDHVPLPADHVHPIQCVHSPEQAASEYEALLRAFFAGGPPRFDFIFLGLGENGHTASLFPNTPVLDEESRWVAEVYVAEQALWRVTLTAALINRAAVVAFLVSGSAKAQALRRVLQGPREPHSLPAQLVSPLDGELYWMVDRQASHELDTSDDGLVTENIE
jgi:6-phosphogluconolactonase